MKVVTESDFQELLGLFESRGSVEFDRSRRLVILHLDRLRFWQLGRRAIRARLLAALERHRPIGVPFVIDEAPIP